MHTIFLDHAKHLAYAASVSPLRCVSVSLHVHHSLILSLSLHPPSPNPPTIGLHRAEDMTRDVEAKEMLLTRFRDARPSLVSCWLQARSPSFHATAATGWSGSARPNCPAHHILEPSPQSPDTAPRHRSRPAGRNASASVRIPHGPLFSSSFHIVVAGYAVAPGQSRFCLQFRPSLHRELHNNRVEMIDTLSHSRLIAGWL